jgi:hypothetical protein
MAFRSKSIQKSSGSVFFRGLPVKREERGAKVSRIFKAAVPGNFIHLKFRAF